MNTWMNNPQYLAQVGHCLGALSLMLFATLFWGMRGAYAMVGVGIGVAAAKEFWYDMVYELPKQTWADSWMDFGFYMVGAAVGLGVMAIYHYGLKRG